MADGTHHALAWVIDGATDLYGDVALPASNDVVWLVDTDGFARLVTDHGLYAGWADVVTDALDKGLGHQEKRLRDAEADPSSVPVGRFKRADDAAAILLTGAAA